MWAGDADLRDKCAVAGRAHLRILAAEGRRVESGAMRIEAAPAQSGVTGKAVPFGVAGCAAFEILACRLPVAQQKETLGIMIAGVQLPPGAEPARYMAVGAKLAGVVAVAARGLPRVGGGRMTGEEAGWVITRGRIRRIRPMAVETLRTDVTPLAGAGPRTRHRTMNFGKIQTVGFGSPPPRRGTLSPARARSGEALHTGGLLTMTSQAALLGMAGRTGSCVPARQRPVLE